MATTHEEVDRWQQRERGVPSGARKHGWWEIAKRTRREVARDNVPLVAAGVAFFSLLALPSALAALIALWGLVADPEVIQAQIAQLSRLLPPAAASVLNDQLSAVVSRSPRALGWAAAVAFVLSVWSARAAVNAMVRALNIVYQEEESRGFFKRTLSTILLTLAVIVGGVLALLLVAGIPALLHLVGLGAFTEALVHIVRWIVLIALVIFGLAMLYRFGPSRQAARWQWISWGAGTAALLWMLASIGFSAFVANFGRYGETYGAIAGVVLLLLWFWISAYAALIGAEINSEIEQLRRQRTIERPQEPTAERDVYVSDQVSGEPGSRT